MARTLLQMVQQACGETGLPQPQFLFGSQNDQENQLIALAQREVYEFMSAANKNGGWQDLHKEYTFTTQFMNTTGNITATSQVITGLASTAGLEVGTWAVSSSGFPAGTRIQSIDSATQVTVTNPATSTATGQTVSFGKIAYDMPSDFEYFVQKTFWDNKYKWSLIGPITAQEKQILRYGVIASGPRNKFYVRANKMWLDPVPSSATLIAYDYYSNAPVITAGGNSGVWTSDTDTYALDDDAFIQGLKWRFLRAKGFDYGEEFSTYELTKQRIIARDGGSRDLPLASDGYRVNFLDYGNIPDSGYGGV